MSHSIIVGSTLEDAANVYTTIEVLKFTKELLEELNIPLPNNDTFSSDNLDSLISWYTGIHTILTDPSAFFTNSEQL